MKRLQTFMVVLLTGFFLGTTPLHADTLSKSPENPNYLGNQSEWDTFGGVDFKQSWVSSKALWKPLLQATGPGLGFYAGQRIHPYVAYELGYGWSFDRIKNTNIPVGSSFAGVAATAGTGSLPLKGRFHLKTAYLDINLLIPMNKAMDQSPEWVLSFGAAMIKPALNVLNTNTGVSLALQGSTKAAGRLGLGIQSFLVGNVGMRLMWRFENTSVLRVGNVTDPRYSALLNNGSSLSLGLFMRL